MRKILGTFVFLALLLVTPLAPAAAQKSWTGNKDLDAAFVLNNSGRDKEAFAAFSKLHAKGVAMAGTMLGRYYEEGRYVAVDTEKAVEFLEEAMEKGDTLGKYHYHRLVCHTRIASNDWDFLKGESGKAAFAEMEEEAKRGNVPLQANLGLAYLIWASLEYAPDAEQARARGLHWIRQAAEADWAPSQFALYVYGDRSSTEWLEKAAKNGWPPAVKGWEKVRNK